MTHSFPQSTQRKTSPNRWCHGHTSLQPRSIAGGASFEHLNITRQDVVQQAHIDYINAGADVIETNSFSGNRLRLTTFGLADQVWKVNVWAAKIARNAREVAVSRLSWRLSGTDG